MQSIVRRYFSSGCVAVALLAGCQSPTLPDPNDPKNVGVLAPDVLRNLLKGASTQFFGRAQRGEITDGEAREFLAEYANSLLRTVDSSRVPKDKAWEYAEVLITAKRWTMAKQFLEIALQNPPNEDRRVNDRLRYGRVLCELGEVKSGIAEARKAFDAPPTDKAPILTAVYLEIVPAGEKKKHDRELAKLIEDSVPQSEQTEVDINTAEGMRFIAARPYHIRKALGKAMELYQRAGDSAAALRVAKLAERF
jgi:tetratricopeptide (TPR) repeat protein